MSTLPTTLRCGDCQTVCALEAVFDDDAVQQVRAFLTAHATCHRSISIEVAIPAQLERGMVKG